MPLFECFALLLLGGSTLELAHFVTVIATLASVRCAWQLDRCAMAVDPAPDLALAVAVGASEKAGRGSVIIRESGALRNTTTNHEEGTMLCWQQKWAKHNKEKNKKKKTKQNKKKNCQEPERVEKNNTDKLVFFLSLTQGRFVYTKRKFYETEYQSHVRLKSLWSDARGAQAFANRPHVAPNKLLIVFPSVFIYIYFNTNPCGFYNQKKRGEKHPIGSDTKLIKMEQNSFCFSLIFLYSSAEQEKKKNKKAKKKNIKTYVFGFFESACVLRA
jgi:hypothetical protein